MATDETEASGGGTSMPRYAFGWGGVEYQLMVFTGPAEDPLEEELVNVYGQDPRGSLKTAALDIFRDMDERQCSQATLTICLARR